MPVDARSFWSIASTFPINKEGVYPEHTIAQEFDQNTGKTVLEYGCGAGSDALSYLRRNCQVVYADIVPGNVLKVQQTIAAHGYATRAKPLVLKSADDIKLADAFVDIVNCHGVLHHIPDLVLRMKVLGEFRRVLKPKGTLYLMLYTEQLWSEHKKQIATLVEEHGITEGEAFGWCTDGKPCPYATYYDEASARDLLKSCGFVVESTFTYNTDHFRTYRAIKA